MFQNVLENTENFPEKNGISMREGEETLVEGEGRLAVAPSGGNILQKTWKVAPPGENISQKIWKVAPSDGSFFLNCLETQIVFFLCFLSVQCSLFY